jgi:hypothetical protein
MNVWGKVLLGLAIVLAAADAYLVAVLHAHRSKWQRDIEGKRASLAQTETALQEAQARVLDRQNELNRIDATWGRFRDNFENPQQPVFGNAHLDVAQARTLNAQDGTLAFSAGADAGIAAPAADKAPPVVHVFINEADGASRYLGELALTVVEGQQAAARLTQQPPLPNTAAALQQLQNQTLRVRKTIPASWRGLFDDYFARHAVINQRLDFQQNQLRIQNEQLTKSQAILAQRLAELNGDSQAPQGASEQVVEGLVVTIRDEESARNEELDVLDELRHEYARKIENLNTLVRQNQQAVSGLPDYEESLAKPDPRTVSN